MSKQPTSLADRACADCGADDGRALTYMVLDSLWETHGAGNGVLCIDCLENRLGRALKWSDFQPCILTMLYLFGPGADRHEMDDHNRAAFEHATNEMLSYWAHSEDSPGGAVPFSPNRTITQP